MAFVALLRQGIEAARSGDYVCAAKCFNRALGIALDAFHPNCPPLPMMAPPVDLGTALASLEGIQADSDSLQHVPLILDTLRLTMYQR